MKSLLRPFKQQLIDFKKDINNKEEIIIGTIGPHGTSSEQAAKYLIQKLHKENPTCKFEIILKDDFQYVLKDLENFDIDYSLIPTAYERITDFFWHYHFANILNFIYETPNYGLVTKKNFDYIKVKKLRMATCHAVRNVFEFLATDVLKQKEIEFVISRSTTDAILKILSNDADIGITNETSYEIYKNRGIMFISKKYNATIVWSLFKRKNINKTNRDKSFLMD